MVRKKVYANPYQKYLHTRYQMPKRKRNGYNNRPFKRPRRSRIYPSQRGFVRTTGFYGRYAKQNGERKFFDTDLDAVFATVGTAMESANLNIIVQGNTESNRIGRKVVLKRCDVKGILTLPGTADPAATSEVVRLLLVCDKQTNGAAFVGTDLWETDAYSAFNNLANSSRFQVLKTKTYTFNSPSGSGRGTTDTLAFGERTIPFKFGINMNLPLEFDNTFTTGVVGTQRSNSLWLVTQSTSGIVIMTLATARVRFLDG